jgi:hypothetical protein
MRASPVPKLSRAMMAPRAMAFLYVDAVSDDYAQLRSLAATNGERAHLELRCEPLLIGCLNRLRVGGIASWRETRAELEQLLKGDSAIVRCSGWNRRDSQRRCRRSCHEAASADLQRAPGLQPPTRQMCSAYSEAARVGNHPTSFSISVAVREHRGNLARLRARGYCKSMTSQDLKCTTTR